MLATLGNLFGPDTLIIFLVVVLLFGAKKLPELARGMTFNREEFRSLSKSQRLDLLALVLFFFAILLWTIRLTQ